MVNNIEEERKQAEVYKGEVSATPLTPATSKSVPKGHHTHAQFVKIQKSYRLLPPSLCPVQAEKSQSRMRTMRRNQDEAVSNRSCW